MQALVEEEGNLRDALARAVAAGEAETGLRLAVGLEPFWLAHGRWEGAADSLDVLLESPSLDAPLAARARTTVANLHLMAGRYDRASMRFDEARELAGRIDNPSTLARALSGLGYVAFRSSKLAEAEALWSQALVACGDHDEWLRANILRSLAIAAGSRGDQVRARDLLGEAADVARSVHDDQLLRLVLSSSAEVNVWLARYETAREHYEESIRLATLIGDHTGRAVILAELGWLDYLTGDYGQAEKSATEAMELAEALQHTRTLISALRVLGEVAAGLGEAEDGRRVEERAVEAARALGSPSELGGALCSLACVHVDQLAIDQAAHAALEASALRALAHTMKRATPEWVMGEAARLRGAVGEAQRHFEAELAFGMDGLVLRHEAQALRGLADVARAGGDVHSAATLHHQALRRRADIGDRVGVANSLEGIARLAADAGSLRRASRLLQAAGAHRGQLGIPPSPREARDVEEARSLIEEGLTGDEAAQSVVHEALNPQQAVELAFEDPTEELTAGDEA
jgi:tetratricopeptide (TPR) repeat protein